MNSIGIDVSKGKSMIAVMLSLGEVVIPPFECIHTESELEKLAKLLKSLPGESRVIMEATGNYHAPVAYFLHDAGFYVCVVNPILLKNYGNNKVRKAKTDKLDAIKIARYGIDRWPELRRLRPLQCHAQNRYRQAIDAAGCLPAQGHFIRTGNTQT